MPDEKWGEAIKAVVQLKEGKKATAEEIIQWCEERLSSIKKPKSVDFMDELPRDINGKVYKRLIRDKYWEGKKTQGDLVGRLRNTCMFRDDLTVRSCYGFPLRFAWAPSPPPPTKSPGANLRRNP